MDILKRELAPITDEAWEVINQQSKEYLKTILSARKFIDVAGPYGWKYCSVPTGQIEIHNESRKGGVKYGVNKVKPLVEARVPFELSRWALDNVSRGDQLVDLSPMEKAARKIAEFEENAIYYGLKSASIDGIKNSTGYKVQAYPQTGEEFLPGIIKGVSMMKETAVEGPYSIIVNPSKWLEIKSMFLGYPLERQLKNIIEGDVIYSPNIKDTLLISQRGGDFKLTLGVDLSIGFEEVNKDSIKLFFTESFTFEVFDPASVIVYK